MLWTIVDWYGLSVRWECGCMSQKWNDKEMDCTAVTYIFKVSEVVSAVLECIGSAVTHIVLLKWEWKVERRGERDRRRSRREWKVERRGERDRRRREWLVERRGKRDRRRSRSRRVWLMERRERRGKVMRRSKRWYLWSIARSSHPISYQQQCNAVWSLWGCSLGCSVIPMGMFPRMQCDPYGDIP